MKRWMTAGVLVAVQVVATGWAVLPQLSARTMGTEYRVEVAPVDPIDPFRGAYVQLTYPGLRSAWEDPNATDPDQLRSEDSYRSGTIYLTLKRSGAVMVVDERLRERPEKGPYLRCHTDGRGTECGIESWFLPQDKATALEDRVREGTAVATIKVDDRGNAALVDVR